MISLSLKTVKTKSRNLLCNRPNESRVFAVVLRWWVGDVKHGFCVKRYYFKQKQLYLEYTHV